MGCQSNNATPPTPAIAPGREAILTREVAERIGGGDWTWPGGGKAAGPAHVDPRLAALVPGWDAPFFQAGLAGYSDAAMRLIARAHGCPCCVTEALLDRTLLAGGRGFAKADLGELHDNVPGGRDDHPLVGQIMGSEPAEMAAAAVKMIEQKSRGEKHYRIMAYGEANPAAFPQRLRQPGGEQIEWVTCGDDDEPSGHSPEPDHVTSPDQTPDEANGEDADEHGGSSFEAIDVNLACPVKKIEKKARGGHWLTDPNGAIRILERVREAVPAEIPCSVKLRRAFDDTPEMAENFEKIFDASYRIGYAWTTVHARTVEQKYVGPSRWTFLRELRNRHPDKIILGSGDVWSVDDIFAMIAYSGVSGVSVARGCIGNPWIFKQARDMMAGRPAEGPTLAQQRAVLARHFELLLHVCRGMRKAEEQAGMQMRKFGIRFAAHHPRTDDVRKDVIAVKSLEDWQRVLDRHYTPAGG